MMHDRSDHSRRGLPAQDSPRFSFKAVNWSRLFGYLKPYRGRMALAILALLLSTGFGLAFPLVIIRQLTTATQQQTYGQLN